MRKLAVVHFPNLNLKEINSFRQRYDPSWKIIAPHITILFPVSGISKSQAIAQLGSIAKATKSFPLSLHGLIKSFDDYLFLQVGSGSQEIIDLHHRLESEMNISDLTRDIKFLPHLTLGYFRGKNNEFDKIAYDKAYEDASKININSSSVFNNFTLIEGDGVSPAKEIKTFFLS